MLRSASAARPLGRVEAVAASSKLKYWGFQSQREVHWYHDFRMAGAQRDKYEVYQNTPEFGQNAITDKDRYPQLYWSIWKGRATIKRVIDQFGYSKDLKPEKLKWEVEKLKHFRQLDSLNFLEATRSAYQYLDEDARGAVGYISEDEVDELREHCDYGKLYCDASQEYRSEVLRDSCNGRPAYEWQVPYGLDEAYGYRDVSTAVDILGNEEAAKNMAFDWRKGSDAEAAVHGEGHVFQNASTGQKMLVCNEANTVEHIENWKPDVVVFQRGAEKLLSAVKSKISPMCPTEMNGLALALAWSGCWYISPLWPQALVFQGLAGAGLIAANGYLWNNVILSEAHIKQAMEACRKTQCDVVLGDWLSDDYNERMHHVTEFDELALRAENPSEHRKQYSKAVAIAPGETNPLKKFVKTALGAKMFQPEQGHPALTSDDVGVEQWMKTYKDAVNDRRLDLLAHVANNVEGEKVLVATRPIDNICANGVAQMFKARITGDYRIDSAPLQFDPYFERVQVAF